MASIPYTTRNEAVGMDGKGNLVSCLYLQVMETVKNIYNTRRAWFTLAVATDTMTFSSTNCRVLCAVQLKCHPKGARGHSLQKILSYSLALS